MSLSDYILVGFAVLIWVGAAALALIATITVVIS